MNNDKVPSENCAEESGIKYRKTKSNYTDVYHQPCQQVTEAAGQ